MSPSGSHSTYEAPGDTSFGVSIFAGVLLVMMGSFEVLQGLSAVLNDSIFIKGQDYTFKLDITAWGWIHMLIGAVCVLVGIGILMGRTWANVVGIALVAVSALSQFLSLPYYPVWSMLLIAMDILIIWALSRQIQQA